MKILYLHPRSWTGEYVILQALRDLGHEVCVLEERRDLERSRARTPDYHESGDGIGTLWYNPRRGWEKLLTLPFDRFFKRAFDGRNLAHRMWVVRAAVRRFRPGVVVCSDGFSYAIPAMFLKRLGLLKERLVVSYIGGDILDCPQADIGKRRTILTDWLIRRSLKGADVLRPVSPLLKRRLRADGAEEARISVCPSHLVAARASLQQVYDRRARVRAAIRSRYGMPPDAPVIATLSSNHKGKGLQVLAAAWPEIRRGLPSCRWLLCGPRSPWVDEAVLPLLGAAATDGSVLLTGPLSGFEVFEHLAAADAHVNPSLCEGLNMVTVEAAAVGVPTITSDGAGIADWVGRYGAGRVVPVSDAPALAAAVVDFFQASGRVTSPPDRCRAMAEEFYPERIAAALVALFRGDTGPAPGPDSP